MTMKEFYTKLKAIYKKIAKHLVKELKAVVEEIKECYNEDPKDFILCIAAVALTIAITIACRDFWPRKNEDIGTIVNLILRGSVIVGILRLLGDEKRRRALLIDTMIVLAILFVARYMGFTDLEWVRKILAWCQHPDFVGLFRWFLNWL